MTDNQNDFQHLIERIRAGSAEAVQQLLDTYGAHIIRVVRRRLHCKLRSKFDSQDFVQAVWASFFAAPVQERLFHSPEELIGFLMRVASNKVIDATRQRMCYQKYNVNREKSLEGSGAMEAADMVSPQPTPSQAAMAQEKWDRLQMQVPTLGRRILELLRQGITHAEIAQRVGVNEKTVRRLVRRLAPEALP